MYDDRAEIQSEYIRILALPWTLVVVLWSVGFIVVALFLPLIKIITTLTG